MQFPMTKKILLSLIAIGFTLLAKPVTSWACAVCFGGADDPITAGFNASVLFLMATPYLVMSFIAGGLVWAYRRARRQREEMESAQSIAPLVWNQEDSGR
jgi:uncharacterized membrane protein